MLEFARRYKALSPYGVFDLETSVDRVTAVMASCVRACALMLTVLVAVVPRSPVLADMFSALVHMEGLVSLEKELLGELESYLELEKNR